MVLDIRLGAAAKLVPQGARLADIGSDHAYLPIALCLENKIDCALASDINEGPVKAAVANIQKNGLGDKITAIRADGLDKAEEFSPDCITVLGMGGELIVTILGRAQWIKKKGITLILQPMTHPEILAEYLAKEGFAIKDETIVCDRNRDDRIYRIICAEYSGEPYSLTPVQALVGEKNIARGDDITLRYVARCIRVLDARVSGKRKVAQDAHFEEELQAELKRILEKRI